MELRTTGHVARAHPMLLHEVRLGMLRRLEAAPVVQRGHPRRQRHLLRVGRIVSASDTGAGVELLRSALRDAWLRDRVCILDHERAGRTGKRCHPVKRGDCGVGGVLAVKAYKGAALGAAVLFAHHEEFGDDAKLREELLQIRLPCRIWNHADEKLVTGRPGPTGRRAARG